MDIEVYRTRQYAIICANAKDAEGGINKKHISNNEEFGSNNKNKIYAYYEFRIYECSIFIA
ncbi:MAG: hypothetical protein BGO33_02755 [Bacteroidia bacterium 43-41]|nr:MAG: hypothetical protein BGO33_02755 [Bacteroidia bacterium 43-41]